MSAWVIVACAAGVLASRRYGAQARAREWGNALGLPGWSVLALAALILSAFVAFRGFGLSIGIAYWLASLSALGAAVIAGVSAWPALAARSVLWGTFIAAILTGVFEA